MYHFCAPHRNFGAPSTISARLSTMSAHHGTISARPTTISPVVHTILASNDGAVRMFLFWKRQSRVVILVHVHQRGLTEATLVHVRQRGLLNITEQFGTH